MNTARKEDAQHTPALDRRSFSVLIGSAASSLFVARAVTGKTMLGMASAGEEEILHSCEAIHQVVSFKANRKQVYEALTNEKQFDKVVKASAAMQSGMALGNAPTQIARQVGGTFSLFGGHIIGRHLELLPGERIVQAWRVATWDAGLFSIARFALAEEGMGTKLTFDHTGFPNGQGEHLAAGWKGNYWEPLQKVLG